MKTKLRMPAQTFYLLLQTFYCLTGGFVFRYAAVFMQSRGFPNGYMGLVLGFSYITSVCLQPTIAAVVDRWNIPLTRSTVFIYALDALLAVLVLVLPVSGLPLALLLILTFSIQSAMQPSVNAMIQVLESAGLIINFGVARGMASLIFAVIMTLVGQALKFVSPALMPLGYLTTMLMMICLIIFFCPVDNTRVQRPKASHRGFPSVRKYPMFWLYLLGIVLLISGHSLVDTYLLQILQNVGGDSSALGIGVGLAALMEFCSMVFYRRFSNKLGCRKLLAVAAWCWVLKIFLLLVAKSPTAVCLAELMQFLTYAIYVPASLEFVGQVLPPSDFLKGQSLTGSAYSLGCVVASFTGGILLELLAIPTILTILIGVVGIGAFLMTIAVSMKKTA